VGPERPAYDRTIAFDLLGIDEARDLSTGLAGWVQRSATQVFRWYEDRSIGTVADPGTVGDPHTDETADYWEVSYLETPEWPADDRSSQYYRTRFEMRGQGQASSTSTGSIVYHLPFDYVLDPPTTYDAYRVLDWRAGDGVNATYYAGTLTLAGAPLDDQETPWLDSAGDDVVATFFDGVDDCYYGSVNIDPSPQQDTVVMALVRAPQTVPSGYDTCVATRRAGNGWALGPDDTSGGSWRFLVDGDTSRDLMIAFVPGEWTLLTGVIDADGLCYLYTNGELRASGATPTGTLGTGVVPGIGAGYDAGAGKHGRFDCRFIQVFVGAALADSFTAANIKLYANYVFGLEPEVGSYKVTFDRNSAATFESKNKVWIAGYGMPRAGMERGFLREFTEENLCYNNFDITVTTGYTASGGTLTANNDDSANLAAAATDLTYLGPYVARIQNSTGSTQYVQCGAVTNSVGTHSISCYARYASGSGAKLGFYDGATFTQAGSLLDSYLRSWYNSVTPGSVLDKWAIQVPTGCDIYFVGAHLVDSTACGTTILNSATAATATRAAETISWTWPATTDAGEISADLTPCYFDATDSGGDVDIIERSTTGIGLVEYDGTSEQFEADDGTNTATVPHVAGHDVAVSVATSWSVDNGELKLTVDGVSDTTTYDGDYGGSGNAELDALTVVGYHTRDLIFRNGPST
jgi:hypothetical protein